MAQQHPLEGEHECGAVGSVPLLGDSCGSDFATLAPYLDLGIDGPKQRRVTAQPLGLVLAAVVDQENEAIQLGSQPFTVTDQGASRLYGAAKCSHIFGSGLVPAQGFRQCVDYDQANLFAPLLDVGCEFFGVGSCGS